jgi:hypothetical protein
VIRVRRYLCRACGITLTVLPRGVAPRFQYAGFAIALAFALWGLERQPAGAVRDAVSTWPRVGSSQGGRWRTLGRWVAAVACGRLFRGVATSVGSLREVAARVAEVAIGRAPPGDRATCRRHRAWRGGEAMA